MELSKSRKASLEVSKFGFHFLAVIRIALENQRIVNSKAHFVAFKTLMSIFLRIEYSLAYLLFIWSSIKSISIKKEGKNHLENVVRMPFEGVSGKKP